MNPEKKNTKINKVNEPSVSYSVSTTKQKGIDFSTFDFDKEFENGYTPEEAKAESIRRIREWWEK